MRPGGQIARRPLHFIWLTDCSGSMSQGGKMEALNTSIREVLPNLRKVASQNPEADVLVRAVAFSTGARWHVGEPTPVAEFEWEDLRADGLTDMGAALELVARGLEFPEGQRGLRPVLVLVSDGEPTDDLDVGLERLNATPWGAKALRLAVAMGHDANHEKLRRFIGNDEYPILQANNADELGHWIRWGSTVAVRAASTPTPAADAEATETAALPEPDAYVPQQKLDTMQELPTW